MNQEFNEKQRIGSWIYMLLGADFFVVSAILYNEYNKTQIPLNQLLWSIGSIIIINSLIAFFIYKSVLYTKVNTSGVHYRFPPFCNQWKTIELHQITEYSIENHASMNHSYSVGKWNWFSKKDSVNTIGTDKAIRIVYHAKKPLFIATDKATEFYNTLHKLKNTEEIDYV
ncbi:hypothetical protein SAMN05216480_101844 [Pustulibacterium marinum]|uniref:Uncharacterized protein n=1 Tax=Pustulibacterium marinum TaxID=1224947 RepID=A0A1I7FC85_9FLAO|nr:hypothetical protein [Pustulibacterium marinum]SFU33782.1 hypothetical protein SAMN05216480_101844 [Pustulibacterium marinum]